MKIVSNILFSLKIIFFFLFYFTTEFVLSAQKNSSTTFDDPILVSTIKAHDKDVFDIDLSPDGRYLVSASADASVKIWQIEKKPLKFTLIKQFQAHKIWTHEIKVSPDSQSMATAGCDEFDVDSNRCLMSYIRVWSLSENKVGEKINVLPGHDDSVWMLGYLNSKQLISSGKNKQILIWSDPMVKKRDYQPEPFGKFDEVNSPYLFPTLPTDTILSFTLNLKDNLMMTGGGSKQLDLWDMSNQIIISQFPHNLGAVLTIDFHPNELIVAVGGESSNVMVWNLENQIPFEYTAHNESVLAVKYHPAGKILATAGCDRYFDSTRVCQKSLIKLWDTDGNLLKELPGHGVWNKKNLLGLSTPSISKIDGIWDLEFNRRGNLLFSASRDGLIKVWDVGIMSQLETLSVETRSTIETLINNQQSARLAGETIFYSDSNLSQIINPFYKKFGVEFEIKDYYESPFKAIKKYLDLNIEAYLHLNDREIPDTITFDEIRNFYRPDEESMSDARQEVLKLGQELQAEVVEQKEVIDEKAEYQKYFELQKLNGISLLREMNLSQVEKQFLAEGFQLVMGGFSLGNLEYEEGTNEIYFDLIAERADFRERVKFEVNKVEEIESIIQQVEKLNLYVVYQYDGMTDGLDAERQPQFSLKEIILNRKLPVGHDYLGKILGELVK